MLGFQLFTLFGVKENRSHYKDEERTTLRDFVQVIFGNDQLLWTTISMILFMVSYCTTTSTVAMEYSFLRLSLAAALGNSSSAVSWLTPSTPAKTEYILASP